MMLWCVVTEWEGTHLDLNKVSRYDMAAYLCIASNGVPPTVSKRISLSVECEYSHYFIFIFLLFKIFI
jgi:hypothetical protein